MNKNNKFECLCKSNFTGLKCETDKRVCSNLNPCLNSLKCQDILISTTTSQDLQFEFDFKCHCKSELFYGKRCESKINLCQNETCSGNGICKIIQAKHQENETIKCECFGQNDFYGEKCEIKSSKMKIKENFIKTTVWIAILSVIFIYVFIFLMDLHRLLTKTNSSLNERKRTKKIVKPKHIKLFA